MDLKTVAKLCRGDYLSMKVETLCRVAETVGVAPAELVPVLAQSGVPPALPGEESHPLKCLLA